jgi:spoIIIJ-associated protein
MQKEYSAKSVEEALEIAASELGVAAEALNYQKISENGFLGFKKVKILVTVPENEPAVESEVKNAEVEIETIDKSEDKVDIVDELVDAINKEAKPAVSSEYADRVAGDFVDQVLRKMGIEANVSVELDSADETIYVNLEGPDMGLLIGKRGQTLDSLQYLTSLVVNRTCPDTYFKVKLDTENYRARRKDTLENLAKNISSKVRRTRRSVMLEPMNPYERRIIHSVLQNDRYVETHSEGEEPYRRVVVTLKKDAPRDNRRYNGRNGSNSRYGNRNSGYKKNNYYGNNRKKTYPKYNDNSDDYSKDYKADYAAYLESKAAAKAAAESDK